MEAIIRRIDNEIHYSGEIDDESILDTIEVIKLAYKEHDNIIFYLTTNGGDLASSKMFYNYMKYNGYNSKERSKIIVNLDCSSAGLIMLMSFDDRYIMPFSSMMTHQGQHTIYARSNTLKIHYEDKVRGNNEYVSIIASNSKMSENEVRSIMTEDTYIYDTDIVRLNKLGVKRIDH